MGFFSSIGSVLGGVGGFLLGGPIGSGLGATIGSGLAGAVGSGVDTLIAKNNADNKYSDAMGFAQSQYQFQQDYIRNAMQWRAEDAKKAGFHPMAALGFSSPSFSPVSAPQYSGYTDSNTINPMEFGQSLNYASAKAKTEKQQEAAFNLSVDAMRLDNQGKQIQNEIAATELFSMQAQLRNSGPAAPQLNAKSPINGRNSSNADGSYAGPSVPLLTLARSGNTLLDVINPDIADSVTESAYRNAIAAITPEYGVAQGYIKPPISYLTPDEQKRVKAGELELVRFPGGWNLRESRSHRALRLPKSDLDKRFFNWVDGFFN